MLNFFALLIVLYWLVCWLTKPSPSKQPDPIGRARSMTACAGERGASLPPRVPRRRRGMTRARPLV